MMLSFLPLNSLIKDKRLWRGPFLYVIMLFVLCNVVILSWQKTLARQRQQNLLLEPKNASSTDAPVRWDKSVGEHLERYLPLMPDATKSPLVVLVGMSQMYAINDAKPEDKIIAEHLDDRLAPYGLRVFGLGAPNMHNEEALLLLLATQAEPKTSPAFFIYGVCFDKFRNIDLRPGFQRYLRQNTALELRWRETAVKYQKRFPHAADKMLTSLASVTAPSNKKNESFEERLRSFVAKIVPLIAARQDLYAAITMKLFELRNLLFNITPQSKRPILKSRYELNQEFLEIITAVALEHGIQPIYYVIPLNPLSANPYIPEQYQSFKSWLQTLCINKKIPFANFESVVPSQYWGEFMGGPDFKHFREEGHDLTSRAIYKEFHAVLLKR